MLWDVTASNTRDSFTDGDGESCALHSTHGTLHAARTLHHMACTRKTRREHAAHMHAYVTVCTWEGGSGSTYICVHAYMTVCTREHLHTHARVRDCVSATVAYVSLCACSVCVLCDVTASNTRDSCTPTLAVSTAHLGLLH